MAKKLLKRRFLLLFTLLFWVLPALATSFAPREFPETVESTSVIVRGKIGMSYSDWGHDADGVKRLYTYYEVQGSEGLKGELAAPSVMIRELGGTKDGVGLNVVGTATFEKGEDIVVFLRDRNSEGVYDLDGMMMAKYNVATDSDGKEMIVGPGLMGQNNPSHKLWSLDDLKALIQTQRTQNKPDGKIADKKLEQKNPSTALNSSAAKGPASSPPDGNAIVQKEEDTQPSQSPFLFWLAGLSTLGGVGLLGYYLSRKK